MQILNLFLFTDIFTVPKESFFFHSDFIFCCLYNINQLERINFREKLLSVPVNIPPSLTLYTMVGGYFSFHDKKGW